MSDELTGIFDDLSPSDFERLTSLVHEQPLESRHRDRSFKEWLGDQVWMTRFTYLATDGALNPAVVLENEEFRRIFTPDDDESLGQYLRRVKAEAELMKAKRFFLAKLTMVDTASDDEPNEVGEMSEADEATARLGILYYGIERKPTKLRRQTGIIFTDGIKLGAQVEAPPTQTVPLFDKVMKDITD